MSLKEQLLNILEQHNHSSDKLDDVLFQLLSPYCLHKTLAQGSPFLENNNGLSEAYVAECTGIAENMFRRLNFSSALLVVYEDCYSENIQDDICFVENCLKGIGKTDVYTFPWKFRPMEETCPAALANNSGVYTCTRRLYETKEIDVQQLFRESFSVTSAANTTWILRYLSLIRTQVVSFIFMMTRDYGSVRRKGIYFPQLGTKYDGIGGFEYENIAPAPIRFHILYEGFHWINGVQDDPEDLCLHGMVSVLGPV